MSSIKDELHQEGIRNHGTEMRTHEQFDHVQMIMQLRNEQDFSPLVIPGKPALYYVRQNVHMPVHEYPPFAAPCYATTCICTTATSKKSLAPRKHRVLAFHRLKPLNDDLPSTALHPLSCRISQVPF